MELVRTAVMVVLLSIGLCLPISSIASDSIITASTSNTFEDVRTDIENAIANHGFVVDYRSHISDMLERTAADVGAGSPVYSHAETWQFCSSILSRTMVEVNPVNIAFCPYIVFAYETVNKPGTVVVGFRKHETEDEQSKATLKKIDSYLEAIVKEAVE